MRTKIPVTGELGPYRIQSTVDSKYAQYYLEAYLADKRTTPSLDKKIDSLYIEFADRLPERNDLERISNDFSTDFAALFWGSKLLSIPHNQEVQKKFVKNFELIKRGSREIASNKYVILLVPGLDYKENGPVTGADLKTQVDIFRAYGLTVVFVEIPPLGTVEENAAVIAENIKKNSNQSILIAGASSAGPAIHLALSKSLTIDETRSVKAWLNLGGVINGSPVIDWIDSGLTYPLWRILIWSKGWKPETFTSLRADVSRERAALLTLPAHIKAINYVGLSLSGNISRFAQDKYWIMSSQGPNDGLALLPDMVLPNSVTIIAPESDHFFAEDPMIKDKSVALLNTVVELVEKKK
mgnify:CR=1 FL=1